METNDIGEFFGEAKAGDGFGWKSHSISATEPNVFRIAPPVKSLKSLGKWNQYYALHYGYTVPNAENPDKPRHKPFQCIFKKNRATGMIEQDCPECQDLAAKENEILAMVNAQIAAGKSKEDAEEFVKGAKRVLREHNLDKKYYVLAKNLAGEWGVLKLPYKVKTAIDTINEKYAKDNGGTSALSPAGGVWYEITRKGKGIGTEYSVQIATESLGGGNLRYKSGALTAVDVEAIKKCPDLATMNDNKVLTYDQILALVRSKGDPTVAQQVFAQPTRSSNPGQTMSLPPPTTVAGPGTDSVTATAQVTQQVSKPVSNPATQTVAGNGQADLAAQIAALQAQLAAAQAQTKPAAPPPASAPAPGQGVQGAGGDDYSNLMSLDPQAFLSKFSDPNKK